MTDVHIITVGNEILSGTVLDRNSHWISKFFAKEGFKVKRRVVIGDELNAISLEIRLSLKSFPSLIIMTGGLGPTFDDKTSEALSHALKRKHCLNKKALEYVRESYKKFFAMDVIASPHLTRERRKMAFIAEGAIPLPNNVGAAPGIMVKKNRTIIISLPGVPKEMKDIMINCVTSVIRNIPHKSVKIEKTIITQFKDESELSRHIDLAMRNIPDVYIKSRPEKFSKKNRIKVMITAEASGKEKAFRLISKASKILKAGI